ncbi:LysR family transcriptional regulator, partial [Mycobacterium sp. CBMA361]|nr:LysR family transcriptional regulator [Mycolicibacterium sp. CBMA 361]
NPAVLALVEAFTRDVGDLGLRDASVWLPDGDPYGAS